MKPRINERVYLSVQHASARCELQGYGGRVASCKGMSGSGGRASGNQGTAESALTLVQSCSANVPAPRRGWHSAKHEPDSCRVLSSLASGNQNEPMDVIT